MTKIARAIISMDSTLSLTNVTRVTGLSPDDLMYIQKANAPAGQKDMVITIASFVAMLGGVVPVSLKETFDITGDGNETDFECNHTKGTKDLVVVLREAFGDYAKVEYTINFTSNSKITVSFSEAPAVGENYKLIII